MPIYNIQCIDCEHNEEVKCSYDELIDLLCSNCLGKIKIIPSITNFKVNGYSYKNGYGNS